MKKMNRLLQSADHHLGALKQHAEKLLFLTQQIQPLLPEEWRDACQISRVTETTLTISTSEQSSITLLRFMQPQLLRHCKTMSGLKTIQEIQFVYAPNLSPQPVKHTPPTIAQAASDACDDVASTCPKPLAEALKKLAKTLKDKAR